jgi:hypothetical protein
MPELSAYISETLVPFPGNLALKSTKGFSRLSVPGKKPGVKKSWLTVKYKYPSFPTLTISELACCFWASMVRTIDRETY